MTAATLHANHAASRAHKTAFFADVVSALARDPRIVWFRQCRDESMIVGQINRQPLLIVAVLPGRSPTDAQLATVSKAVQNGAVGFVAHELREVELYLRRMAR